MRRRLVLANLAALSVLGGAFALTSWHPATDAAVADVRRQVEYAVGVAPDLPREYLTALAVTSYVVGHVSAPAYLYERSRGRPENPDAPRAEVAEQAFADGSGLCGTATYAALTLYEAFGVEARQLVVLYTQPDGLEVWHATTEVFYGGSWHWFDPTWGAFHRDGANVPALIDVLAMSEARQLATLVGNDTLFRTQLELGPMEFTAYSPLRIELDGTVVYSR